MGIANNPYSQEIFRRTALSKVSNMVTADCDCETFKVMHSGDKAEYYDNFNKAAFRFQFHKLMQTTFWAVHYKGKHIVNIKDSK